MDASKAISMICAGILIVCLFFCVTALTSLRNAVDENEAWQEEAQGLVQMLNECVESLQVQVGDTSPPPENEPIVDVNATAQEGYCLREINGKIGAYTEDGALIKTFDVAVATLPSSERELLCRGIDLDTWQQVCSLVQDYGG